MKCKCLENKLKEWVFSFYPNIEEKKVNEFIFEAQFIADIYRKRLYQHECHKSSKKNGYDRLCIDIKRISKTIDSLNKNPILNCEQKQNLINPLVKFEEQLVETYKKCCFDCSLFYGIYKDNKQDAQAKLVVTGGIDSILIRDEFIMRLEVAFKNYTGSKTIKRTEIQRKNNSKSPFLALVMLLYNYIGIKKEKDSVQKDINRATK